LWLFLRMPFRMPFAPSITQAVEMRCAKWGSVQKSATATWWTSRSGSSAAPLSQRCAGAVMCRALVASLVRSSTRSWRKFSSAFSMQRDPAARGCLTLECLRAMRNHSFSSRPTCPSTSFERVQCRICGSALACRSAFSTLRPSSHDSGCLRAFTPWPRSQWAQALELSPDHYGFFLDTVEPSIHRAVLSHSLEGDDRRQYTIAVGLFVAAALVVGSVERVLGRWLKRGRRAE